MLIAALPVHIYERTGSTIAAGLLWVVYPLSGLLTGAGSGHRTFALSWAAGLVSFAGGAIRIVACLRYLYGA